MRLQLVNFFTISSLFHFFFFRPYTWLALHNLSNHLLELWYFQWSYFLFRSLSKSCLYRRSLPFELTFIFRLSKCLNEPQGYLKQWGRVYFALNACMQGSGTSADRPEPGIGGQLYWQVTLLRCRKAGRSEHRYSGIDGYLMRSLWGVVWLPSLI